MKTNDYVNIVRIDEAVSDLRSSYLRGLDKAIEMCFDIQSEYSFEMPPFDPNNEIWNEVDQFFVEFEPHTDKIDYLYMTSARRDNEGRIWVKGYHGGKPDDKEYVFFRTRSIDDKQTLLNLITYCVSQSK